MVNLAKNNSTLKLINKNSLIDKRVNVIIGDAYHYLINNRKKFDVILGMYHDQVLTPLKTLYEWVAVSLKKGLSALA